MLRAYKYRLYPTKEQETLINKNIGCTRFVFNYFLNERINAYKNENKTLTYKDNASSLTLLKGEFKWLKEVDSIGLQQTLRDLNLAYQNFFRRVKKGENSGFPKFKSKRNPKQSYRTQNVNNNIQVFTNQVKLPKIGLVNFKNSREFNGKINSATISRTSTNKYFVSILVETEIAKLPKSDSYIGIDLGIKYFATTSNDEVFENPKFLRKLEDKLKFQQRALSRKKLYSRNWYKQKLIVARIHEKITNIRNDYLQKLSTKLIKENQIICLEDLSVSKMLQEKKISKLISEVSWSKFTDMLKYKANWYGKTISIIDKYFPSSQLCYACKYQNKEVKDISIREWICPNCNNLNQRDYNASKNILAQGLKLIG